MEIAHIYQNKNRDLIYVGMPAFQKVVEWIETNIKPLNDAKIICGDAGGCFYVGAIILAKKRDMHLFRLFFTELHIVAEERLVVS